VVVKVLRRESDDEVVGAVRWPFDDLAHFRPGVLGTLPVIYFPHPPQSISCNNGPMTRITDMRSDLKGQRPFCRHPTQPGLCYVKAPVVCETTALASPETSTTNGEVERILAVGRQVDGLLFAVIRSDGAGDFMAFV